MSLQLCAIIITSCLWAAWAVMSFPGSNLDEVRNFLDTNHPEQYLVFNLSDKTYDTAALHGQVCMCVWS